MPVPCEIALRNVEDRESVEALVLGHVAKLERFSRGILHCRVMVEVPHPRRRTGNVHHVRIELTLRGRQIVVRRDPPEHQAHEDLGLALRDAFRSARRQVEDHVRETHHLVKTHAEPRHGRVVRLFPDEGYGFLAPLGGTEVYFHRDAVLGGGFARLKVGDEVRYAEETGDEGPQASTVARVGRHGGELPASPRRKAGAAGGAPTARAGGSAKRPPAATGARPKR